VVLMADSLPPGGVVLGADELKARRANAPALIHPPAGFAF
jgi:hypothetical protein